MNDTKLNPEYVDKIAKVCHQTNKAYCETLGDNSQKDWDDAEEWQRESARNGVVFKINNPDAGDDAQHNAWMKDKVDDGWKYGDVKDAEAKTHPCIVPYEQLPVDQRIKDTLFRSVVEAMHNS